MAGFLSIAFGPQLNGLQVVVPGQRMLRTSKCILQLLQIGDRGLLHVARQLLQFLHGVHQGLLGIAGRPAGLQSQVRSPLADVNRGGPHLPVQEIRNRGAEALLRLVGKGDDDVFLHQHVAIGRLATGQGVVLQDRLVSPSISTIWFDQAKAMLPFGRMLRLALPIQCPETFRLSR